MNTSVTPRAKSVDEWAVELNLAEREQRRGLPAGIMKAVMGVESSGNPTARSPKNAQGLFQIIPATASRFGVNPWQPQSAADGAEEYLSFLYNRYKGHPDRLELTLAGYNAGEGHADAKRDGKRENFYYETQKYVNNVKGRMGLPGGTIYAKDSGKKYDTVTGQEGSGFNWSSLLSLAGPAIGGLGIFFLSQMLLGAGDLVAGIMAVGFAIAAGPSITNMLGGMFSASPAAAATRVQGPATPVLALAPEQVGAVVNTPGNRPGMFKIEEVKDAAADAAKVKLSGVSMNEDLSKTKGIVNMDTYISVLKDCQRITGTTPGLVSHPGTTKLDLQCIPAAPVASQVPGQRR
ncbi:MAG: lytic transglycosylase domain-containing protein [Rickettsiales bacterium]